MPYFKAKKWIEPDWTLRINSFRYTHFTWTRHACLYPDLDLGQDEDGAVLPLPPDRQHEPEIVRAWYEQLSTIWKWVILITLTLTGTLMNWREGTGRSWASISRLRIKIWINEATYSLCYHDAHHKKNEESSHIDEMKWLWRPAYLYSRDVVWYATHHRQARTIFAKRLVTDFRWDRSPPNGVFPLPNQLHITFVNLR